MILKKLNLDFLMKKCASENRRLKKQKAKRKKQNQKKQTNKQKHNEAAPDFDEKLLRDTNFE